MFKNLGLKWKIMSILVVVVPVIVVLTTYLTASFISQMRVDATERSVETAYRLGNKIQADMNVAMSAARALARLGEGMAGDSGAPARENLLEALHGFIADHPNYLGVFYAFEPDALDGRDSDYVGAEMHNEDGRFVPWIYHANGGGTGGRACSGYATDDGGGAWYHLPRKLGHEIVMEPWAYEMDGGKVLMVDMVVPMQKDGRFIGVTGIDFPMGSIDKFVRQIQLYDTGYAYLVSNKGAFMAHPESEKYVQGKVNFFESDEFPDALKDGARNRVLKGEPLTTTLDEGDGEVLYTMVPVNLGRTDTPLMLVLRIPMDEVLASAHAMRNNALYIGLGALALIVGAMLYISRSLSVPIVQTANAVGAIADGDLAVRLPAESGDEVGRMQTSVNHLAEKLSRNMEEICARQDEAEERTKQAQDATCEAEAARAAAETAKVDGMMAAAHRLETIVANLSAASEEISAQSNEIMSGSETQRERIATTATAMEEMNATVLEVARNATETAEQSSEARENAAQGAEVVNQTVQAMSRIQTQAEELTGSMGRLGEQAEAIGAIMTVIEDIADQTNLLALNAAIEAARAGEAGRGFAVVADEVRKLAEKTMGATKEVGDSIRSIQDVARGNIKGMEATVEEIGRATELSQRSGEMLNEIVGGVERSAERIQSIATAAEQQSATSEEINRSVDEINAIAMDTAQAVQEAAEASGELARQAMDLSLIIQDLKNQG